MPTMYLIKPNRSPSCIFCLYCVLSRSVPTVWTTASTLGRMSAYDSGFMASAFRHSTCLGFEWADVVGRGARGTYPFHPCRGMALWSFVRFSGRAAAPRMVELSYAAEMTYLILVTSIPRARAILQTADPASHK